VNPLDRGWAADAIYTPLIAHDFFCELHREGSWPRLESLESPLAFSEMAPSRLLWHVRGGSWEDTLALSLPYNPGLYASTPLQGLLWVGVPLLVLAIKTQLICLLFVVVRAALPRLRFDQLLALN
jgi:hypothetical protein